MRKSILVVDDEKTVRETLAHVLEDTGFKVASAADGLQAVQLLAGKRFDVALVDIRMPGLNGLEVLARARQISPDTQVILITAFGTVESAVEAIKLGASDYVVKPFVFDDIIIKINRLLNIQRLAAENKFLRTELGEQYRFDGIVGHSEEFTSILETVQKLAQTRTTALITGESGTGKELIARAIHYGGITKEGKFVAINCAALSENLVESELFGHKRGAFSGADSDKLGLFEIADLGTVFLDEVSSMPVTVQAKLLRAIEEKQVLPLGGTEPVEVEARILCATNADLKAQVENGLFREDLYYRLSVVEIHVPPLRERREDIPALMNSFVEEFSRTLNKSCRGLTDRAVRAMMAYSWPGNVRELKNVIERATIFSDNREIDIGDLAFMADQPKEQSTAQSDLRSAMRAYEKQHILQVLACNKFDKTATARALSVGLSSLYRKMDDLGICKKGNAQVTI